MSRGLPYDVVGRQFGAAFSMLGSAIEGCPPALWERPSQRMGYWYIAYHVLFFVDHDLHPADEEFRSASFDRYEYELKDVAPPFTEVYTQSEILGYLAHCRVKVEHVLSGLMKDEPLEVRGSDRLNMPVPEVVLYELRHVQHHAAQLNMLLRLEGLDPPRWVRHAAMGE